MKRKDSRSREPQGLIVFLFFLVITGTLSGVQSSGTIDPGCVRKPWMWSGSYHWTGDCRGPDRSRPDPVLINEDDLPEIEKMENFSAFNMIGI